MRLQTWVQHDDNLRGNEDVNDTFNPSAQNQHNNQPYIRGEEAMATKSWRMMAEAALTKRRR